MQICTSPQTDNHASIPPQQRLSTEGQVLWIILAECCKGLDQISIRVILLHSVLGEHDIRLAVVGCKKLSGGMLAWLSGMRCRLAYSPADATATHYLLLQQIQIGFNLPGTTFLVPAHPGGPGHIPEEQ